jgi:hypothetical protein
MLNERIVREKTTFNLYPEIVMILTRHISNEDRTIYLCVNPLGESEISKYGYNLSLRPNQIVHKADKILRNVWTQPT